MFQEDFGIGLVYEAELLSRLSRGRDDRTGYEEVFGQTPNIAEHVDFEFYDLVWWWDRGDRNSSTADPKQFAGWLGISHRIGSDMCYWLITESGQIISKSSVQLVIKDDSLHPSVKESIEKNNKRLVETLNDSNHRVELPEGAEKYRLPDVPLPDELELCRRSISVPASATRKPRLWQDLLCEI